MITIWRFITSIRIMRPRVAEKQLQAVYIYLKTASFQNLLMCVDFLMRSFVVSPRFCFAMSSAPPPCRSATAVGASCAFNTTYMRFISELYFECLFIREWIFTSAVYVLLIELNTRYVAGADVVAKYACDVYSWLRRRFRLRSQVGLDSFSMWD